MDRRVKSLALSKVLGLWVWAPEFGSPEPGPAGRSNIYNPSSPVLGWEAEEEESPRNLRAS